MPPSPYQNVAYDAPLSFTEPTWLWRRYKCFWEGTRGKTLTDQDVPAKDLSGRWILISGANSGIGEQAALHFARCGANLVLACRVSPAEKHPGAVADHCTAEARAAGHAKSVVEWWEVDMGRLASVEALAARWLATGRPLDVLCNNAGMGTNPGGVTRHIRSEDGFELVHQVNFLSHVLLTLRLLPALAAAPAPRVVCTTSCMTYVGVYDLANFNGDGCHGVQLYNNNKLYFQCWVVEMHERLMRSEKYRHLTINGVHPGYVNTGIWTFKAGEGILGLISLGISFVLQCFARLLGITPKQGSYCITNAATSVDAGPDPLTQGVGEKGGRGGGRYFNRIWEARNMPHTEDADARLRVWRKVDDELRLTEKGLLSWTD
ncbi:NAD(P)-binding domain protein [Cordyceps fumosorosea ARSEF 2679]|uniref:NAD(P)-binding domain protein n=1 Tax=Cordyceps fumosorosea (strain ARSEF 2679) TaxID=1081104 RepID=A0A168DGL9_CORFA|nr:NAD(P)-binding domain protein [Cordyceps fumosorosea ARSEF 2679]OAA72591.1 NAD(P)-binding domain protein [Cordyceps fumosorosea ARSEF 2679]